MANKILEKTLNNVSSEDLRAGYAAPMGSTSSYSTPPPVTTNYSDVMSVSGSARAALSMFVLLLAAGTWAWTIENESTQTIVLLGGVFGGLILGLITAFVPMIARFTAPLYAIAQGLFLGTISRFYEDAYDGIVVQAVLATAAIVFVMYSLYSTRVIKVTQGFRRTVLAATLGIFVFYMANMFLSFFGVQLPFIWDTGMTGIIFSAVVICIAAANLALDFDFIERGSQAGLPKYMNWAAAFGLLATVIWIYVEVLRLLAKSRN